MLLLKALAIARLYLFLSLDSVISLLPSKHPNHPLQTNITPPIAFLSLTDLSSPLVIGMFSYFIFVPQFAFRNIYLLTKKSSALPGVRAYGFLTSIKNQHGPTEYNTNPCFFEWMFAAGWGLKQIIMD